MQIKFDEALPSLGKKIFKTLNKNLDLLFEVLNLSLYNLNFQGINLDSFLINLLGRSYWGTLKWKYKGI